MFPDHNYYKTVNLVREGVVHSCQAPLMAHRIPGLIAPRISYERRGFGHSYPVLWGGKY
jgi:hypothetical protein